MEPFNGTDLPLEEADLAVERVDGELQPAAAAGVERGLGPGRRHCRPRRSLASWTVVDGGLARAGWLAGPGEERGAGGGRRRGVRGSRERHQWSE